MTDRDQNPTYSMIIEWDPRDDIFVVTIPEFARSRTDGRTYEEAARNGQEAIAIAVELDRELGLPLPVPSVFDAQRSDRWWDTSEDTLGTVTATGETGYPPYSMFLASDPRDDIVIATIAEFRGARTHGNSYVQAARMGREVIEMFVDQAREDGEPLPSVHVFRPHHVEAVV